jgi:hypothetical protein
VQGKDLDPAAIERTLADCLLSEALPHPSPAA